MKIGTIRLSSRSFVLSLVFLGLCLAGVCGVASCSDGDSDGRLVFTGSSHVALWDLERFFPTHITRNCGLSGSGVAWVEQNAGNSVGATAVVVSGGNDGPLRDAGLEEYCQRMLTAIINLQADKTIYVSAPPRDWPGDGDWVEPYILGYNEAMKRAIEQSGRKDVKYLEIHDALVDGRGKLDLRYQREDGLHLNDEGYRVVSEILKRAL